MEPEIVLALIGVGITIVLLAALSVYQQARAKQEKEEKIADLRMATAAAGDAPPGGTPFFIACFRGNNARYFRVYRDRGELLFLYAGPFFAMIDSDTPRGSEHQHWMFRSLKLAGVTLAVGAVGAVMAVLAIARGIAQNVAANPAGAADTFFGVFGIIALIGLVVVILIPISLWSMNRRALQLDALPLSGLREEAETNERSFRAGPDTVSELKLALLDQRQNFRPSEEIGCVMSFRHVKTGRWKIETLATRDTRDALAAIEAVWPPEAVTVDEALTERLAAPAGVAPVPVPAAAVPALEPEPDLPRGWGTYSVSGFGTAVFEARGLVKWDSSLEDCDAILAFCVLAIPIVPYKAIHSYQWEFPDKPGAGFQFRSVPIRWSWGLVGAALAHKLLFWVLVAAGFCLVFALFSPLELLMRLLLIGAALAVLTAGFTCRWLLNRADQRHRDIRLLLGRHVFGSSDPAFWTRKLLRDVQPPQQAFGLRRSPPRPPRSWPRTTWSGRCSPRDFPPLWKTAATGND